MKSKFYIFSFLMCVVSCRTPFEKTLGCYQGNTFAANKKETKFLSFNEGNICILTSKDSTNYAYWELNNDTISIITLEYFDTLTYVRNRGKLHLLKHNSLDSINFYFKKNNKHTQGIPKWLAVECAFRSNLQSADKLYQVAQSTGDISLIESALDLYMRAEKIKPGDPHTREMIEILTHYRRRLEDKKDCIKILSKADAIFENIDYKNAMKLYKIYLDHNCNYFLEHVKNRIILLDSLQN